MTTTNTEPQRATTNKQETKKTPPLLGAAEQKRLQKELVPLAKQVHESGAEILVGMDRSGRPITIMLAQILKQAYGKIIPVFFLRPNETRGLQAMSRELYEDLPSQRMQELEHFFNLWVKDLREKLERKHPTLIKSIKGKRVALIDDQVHTNATAWGMQLVLEKYGARGVQCHSLSKYPQKKPYSWSAQKFFLVSNGTGFVLRRTKRTGKELQRELAFRRKLDIVATRTAQRIKSRK
jgi:adenine/guanine phosphoribosyltransferase-like PRPP-binding protein